MIKELKESEFNQLDNQTRTDLLKLVPEEAKKPIVIGAGKYWLYPPSMSDFKKMIACLSKYFKAWQGKTYIEIIEFVLDKAIPEILELLGLPNDGTITSEQSAYLLNTYIELAVKFSNLPESVRKNLKRLWAGLYPQTEATFSKQFSPEKMQESSSASSISSVPKSSEIDGKDDVDIREIIAQDVKLDV